MGTITARLQRRALLLEEWRRVCESIIDHAANLRVDEVEAAIADRSVLLERIMDDHRQYAWSDSERKQMRAFEDKVEQALLACHALLRGKVGDTRRRGTAVTRYAEHARGR